MDVFESRHEGSLRLALQPHEQPEAHDHHRRLRVMVAAGGHRAFHGAVDLVPYADGGRRRCEAFVAACGSDCAALAGDAMDAAMRARVVGYGRCDARDLATTQQLGCLWATNSSADPEDPPARGTTRVRVLALGQDVDLSTLTFEDAVAIGTGFDCVYISDRNHTATVAATESIAMRAGADAAAVEQFVSEQAREASCGGPILTPRQILARALGLAGCRVVVAASLRQALAALFSARTAERPSPPCVPVTVGPILGVVGQAPEVRLSPDADGRLFAHLIVTQNTRVDVMADEDVRVEWSDDAGRRHWRSFSPPALPQCVQHVAAILHGEATGGMAAQARMVRALVESTRHAPPQPAAPHPRACLRAQSGAIGV